MRGMSAGIFTVDTKGRLTLGQWVVPTDVNEAGSTVSSAVSSTVSSVVAPDYTQPPAEPIPHTDHNVPAYRDIVSGETSITLGEECMKSTATATPCDYMNSNVTTPDPIVINRVFDYLRMCDDEHRKNVSADAEIAKRDKQIEEITERASNILKELDDLKEKYARVQDEYGVMSRKCDELFAENHTLRQEHATLKRHFDIIANGFAVVNSLVMRGNE